MPVMKGRARTHRLRLAREGLEGAYGFYEAIELVDGVPVVAGELTITPVSVDHVVPTFGFLIEDADNAVIIASDTAPTHRIWELAARPGFRSKLRAVFLECSLANSAAKCALTLAVTVAESMSGTVRMENLPMTFAGMTVLAPPVEGAQANDSLSGGELPLLRGAIR